MQPKPIIDPDLFVDGECTSEQAAQFREEMTADPTLVEKVEQLQAVNQQLRTHAQSVQAPESLHDSLSDLINASEQQPANSRRSWLIGSGAFLAASVAGVAGVSLVRQMSPNTKPNLVTTTFFKDFETYLVKDRSLDIEESDLLTIASWYEPRLPFQLPPISSSGGGASLIGGRLCWLLERRLASLSFDSPKGPIVLYISQAHDLELPPGGKSESFGNKVTWHRSQSSSSLIWTNDGLLMAMVGTQEVNGLKRIARSIFS